MRKTDNPTRADQNLRCVLLHTMRRYWAWALSNSTGLEPYHLQARPQGSVTSLAERTLLRGVGALIWGRAHILPLPALNSLVTVPLMSWVLGSLPALLRTSGPSGCIPTSYRGELSRNFSEALLALLVPI